MSDLQDYVRLLPYGYAPGDYMSKCCTCGKTVPGVDKRATRCRSCAESMYKDNEIERLRAEVAALREDAERYRWLRQHYAALTRMEIARGLGLDLSRVYVNTAEKFDAAIDAARAKGGA